MPRARVNGCELYYEDVGEGDPLVLVHGSWLDHHNWDAVVDGFAETFRVITYDRRGHSQSERPSTQGSRREDEDDLAALLEGLDAVPAHVGATSFGACIALGLAARRPDLFRSLVAHEPPLVSIVADDPDVQPLLATFREKVGSIIEQLEGGDVPGGTRRFVDEIARGPGAWDQLPEEGREIFLHNAPTWLDEGRDHAWAELDLDALAQFPHPVLLTQGDQSRPWFPRIVERLAQTIDGAQRHTYVGAGHTPQASHPQDYVTTVSTFLRGQMSTTS